MDHTVLELEAEEKNSQLLHYDPIFWGYFEVTFRLLLLGVTLGVTLGLLRRYFRVNLGLFCGCFGYREAIIFLSVLFLHFIIYRTKNMVGQPFATCGFTKGLQCSGVILGLLWVQ